MATRDKLLDDNQLRDGFTALYLVFKQLVDQARSYERRLAALESANRALRDRVAILEAGRDR